MTTVYRDGRRMRPRKPQRFEDESASIRGRDRIKEIVILLPEKQRQHRTLHIKEDVLPLRIALVTLLLVSRACEHFPDGFDLQREKKFFIDNQLVRIDLIIEIILVDRPCAMGD